MGYSQPQISTLRNGAKIAVFPQEIHSGRKQKERVLKPALFGCILDQLI